MSWIFFFFLSSSCMDSINLSLSLILYNVIEEGFLPFFSFLFFYIFFFSFPAGSVSNACVQVCNYVLVAWLSNSGWGNLLLMIKSDSL